MNLTGHGRPLGAIALAALVLLTALLAIAPAAPAASRGNVVEVHDDPEIALCDGPQALYASQFADYARDVAAHASLLGKRLA